MLQIGVFDQVSYICDFDPAVDKSHKDYDLAKYLRTLDEQHCPIKEGATPARFKILRLSRKAYQFIKKQPDDEQELYAVAYGLKGVSGLKDRNGNEVQLSFKETELGGRLDEDTLDRIFSPGLISQVGTVVMSLSRVSPLV